MDALSGLSRDALSVIQMASAEARDHGQVHLAVEHLALALCRLTDTSVSRRLESMGLDRKVLRERLSEACVAADDAPADGRLLITPRVDRITCLARGLAQVAGRNVVPPISLLDAILLEGRSEPVRVMQALGAAPVDAPTLAGDGGDVAAGDRAQPSPHSTPYLDRYGRDLCQLAGNGQLRAPVGRDAEMLAVVRVLARHERSNPLLIGEPGVGKTCVVEGLAHRAIQPGAPGPLVGKRIVQLSASVLVANAQYRGEFEGRLETVLKEAGTDPSVILFFDEMHTLLGAGAGGGGALDAANILKPALGRGDISCIGATTTDEYHRYIESDPALARRFEVVKIPEPSPAETLQILHDLGRVLGEHHQIRIEEQVLPEVVRLTQRYMPDRFLPDKAVDLLDRACAEARISTLTGTDSAPTQPVVDLPVVARVLSKLVGIPVGLLSQDDTQALLHLREKLGERVVGQDDALDKVSECVIAGRELGMPNRPDGVLFFMGPTGVGKTEVARALAAELFGSDRQMVRIDMSEYGEAHTVSRLIGAPPGYVGHDEEGQLTGPVRRRPYCVVLLDEVEKAHPDVLKVFLQVFDDARVTDARGRTVDFSNTIIIMTSNLGGDVTQSGRRQTGFRVDNEEPSEDQDAVQIRAERELAKAFPPEFVNRIDEVVAFRTLSSEAIERIVRMIVCEVESELAGRQLHLRVAPEFIAFLGRAGYNKTYGAREARRTVDRRLRKPLAQFLLVKRPASGSVIQARLGAQDKPIFCLGEDDVARED